jgi:hypothetical protein
VAGPLCVFLFFYPCHSAVFFCIAFHLIAFYLCRISHVPRCLKQVAIGGFCTVQPAIYRPGTLRDAVPVVESVMATWEAAAAKGADALVPLTHQLIHEDCELLHALHKHPHTRGRVPYVLGGHEHEIYEVPPPQLRHNAL